MADIFDYLDWRGDVPFSVDPFNEVDALICTQISFLDFSGIADGRCPLRAPNMRDAAKRYFAAHPQVHLGKLVPDRIPALFRKAASTRRFGDLRLFGFTAVLDPETETQFAALSFALGLFRTVSVYRGTDDTLVGWKENFNMGYMETVPAQRMAADYLADIARHTLGKLYVAGHSKGGNLAVYAAQSVPARVQKRILRVWNDDGPGFASPLSENAAYARICDRVVTIVPHFSVVGMLLEHGKVDKVIRSSGNKLWQHDPCTWEVKGNAFVCEERGLARESARTEAAVKAMVAALSVEERRALVDSLYQIFTETHATTLTDLSAHKLDFVRALGKADGNTRKVLLSAVKLFVEKRLAAAHTGEKTEETV